MKKMLCGVIATVILLMPLYTSGDEDEGTKEGIIVEKNIIFINNSRVEEQITFKSMLGHYNGTLQLWAPSKAQLLKQDQILTGEKEGNFILLNLGEHNLTIKLGKNLSLNMVYGLPEPFEKQFIYKTEKVKLHIRTEKYPRGDLPLMYVKGYEYVYSSEVPFEPGEEFMLEFIEQKQTEANIFSLALGVVAILLAIILIGYIFIGIKRRGKVIAKESDESLELRKRLLMDALKTLELEHEKEKISDTYYASIKDYFKGEAIKVLKEIEKRK